MGPIDLRAIFDAIARQSRLFFATLVAVVLLGIVYLHMVDYRYAVILQVTPVSNEDKGATSRLGQIASAAGIDIGGATAERVDSFDLFLEAIYTRDTAEALARDQPLMRAVFYRDWDDAGQRWRDPRPSVTAALNFLRRTFGLPAESWQPPDGARVESFILKNVQIERDIKNPVVTLQMNASRPEVARQFLTRLHAVDDELLRERSLARTSKYIDYLNSEIRKVTFEEYRQALLQLLSDQEKRRMFANSPTVAYAAELFQSATFDPDPAQPRPVLVLVLCVIAGTMLGGVAAFARDQWPAMRKRPAASRA